MTFVFMAESINPRGKIISYISFPEAILSSQESSQRPVSWPFLSVGKPQVLGAAAHSGSACWSLKPPDIGVGLQKKEKGHSFISIVTTSPITCYSRPFMGNLCRDFVLSLWKSFWLSRKVFLPLRICYCL